MKAYKTLLFIVAVFILLALVGYAIPTEGIDVGTMNIKFPSAEEMMQKSMPEEEEEIDPVKQAMADAEAIKAFIAEQQLSEDKRIRLEAIRCNNAIKFPNDSIEWMDKVFAALDNAKKKPIRIIHYGDSQIEEDRMSSDLRALFQNKFGGYGVGLLPAVQTIPTTAISQSCDIGMKKYLIYGGQDSILEGKNYGVMGQTAQLDGTANFMFKKLNMSITKANTKQFGNVTILLNEIESPIEATITYGSATEMKRAELNDSYIKFILPDATSNVNIRISGKCKIDGFILDGNSKGVALDNAAMRGCSGTIFTSISSESLGKYFNRYSVPLIIMQFGGNTIPYITTDKAIKNYCLSIGRQIRYLKKISPNSQILFIGPSDMSTFIEGKRESYQNIPEMIEGLKEVCAANDAAYWDLYQAMGGKNSMIEWVNANPPLAGSDHIHFTVKGAKKASIMLYDAIMTAYGYYEYRKDN